MAYLPFDAIHTSRCRQKEAVIVRSVNGLDWIVQCLTSPPIQYRLYWRRVLQVKRPNQQYQSTEGSYKRQIKQRKQHKHTCRDNNAHTKRYTHIKHRKFTEVYRIDIELSQTFAFLLITCTCYSWHNIVNSWSQPPPPPITEAIIASFQNQRRSLYIQVLILIMKTSTLSSTWNFFCKTQRLDHVVFVVLFYGKHVYLWRQY